jgi:hypothetical protein
MGQLRPLALELLKLSLKPVAILRLLFRGRVAGLIG